MEANEREILLSLLKEYRSLGINQQIDYDKFYLYSLITHSTAIEGSTVTEIENQLLFDEGISAKGRPIVEQLMNLDLKSAYEESMRLAQKHVPITVELLKELSSKVMKNTGSHYSTLQGEFDSSKGDFRLVNVTEGIGGSSYMNPTKVSSATESLCEWINAQRNTLKGRNDEYELYMLSFDAHYLLVTIHPWVDGNGRMARLLMNHLQFEQNLIPSKVNKEDKAEYIKALMESRETESLIPFRQFMLQEHIKNLREEISTFCKTNNFDPLRSIKATER